MREAALLTKIFPYLRRCFLNFYLNLSKAYKIVSRAFIMKWLYDFDNGDIRAKHLCVYDAQFCDF